MKSRLEANIDELAAPEPESRLDKLEESIDRLKIITDSENIKKLFNDYSQNIYQDLKESKNKILRLDDSASSRTQELFTKIQYSENQIKGLQTIVLSQGGEPQQSNELNDQFKDLIDLLQLEIDDLDERQKKLGNQLESHSSNVTQRFQKADIDLNVKFKELQEEIHKLCCYIDSIISPQPPTFSEISEPSIPP